MTSWEGKRLIPVVSACMRADGLPDFAITEVEVTHDEYENGVHYLFVEDRLADDGFEEPWVHFDQFEAPDFLISAVKEHVALKRHSVQPFVQEEPDATQPV